MMRGTLKKKQRRKKGVNDEKRHISRREISDLSTLDALRLRSTDLNTATFCIIVVPGKRNPLPSNGNKFLPSLSQLDELLGTYHGVYLCRCERENKVATCSAVCISGNPHQTTDKSQEISVRCSQISLQVDTFPFIVSSAEAIISEPITSRYIECIPQLAVSTQHKGLSTKSYYFLFSQSPTAITMISSKKLINMAKKWHKFVAIRRKRISFPEQNEEVDGCSTSSAVNKGHFVIYTADQKRFVIPLSFLNNKIIRQLLEMSEEEFGLPSDGPITLPCDAVFMKYIISLLSRGVSTQLQNALLVSIASNRCSSASLHQGWRNQQLIVC
nr:auxin-responsive protein SAUR68-like [Ipomoea batatas]